jgi:tetratricopeptide (TPR) repeat protein
MFVRKYGFVFLLLASFSFFPGFTWCADEEAAGQAAEKGGRFREALTHYTAALQATSPGSEAEHSLLDRAAAVSSKVTPLPALPAEAERRLVRGQALVESAKDADAFLRAASEFRAAVRAAPWLADAHYNLGVVLNKAQRFDEAIHSLKLSILVAPNAKEAGEAQRLIYRIEVRQEEAQRAKAEGERKAEQQRLAQQREEEARTTIQGLAGNWVSDEGTDRYVITVSGNSIEIVYSEMYNPVRKEWLHWRQYGFSAPPQTWRGNMEKLQIQGTFTQRQKPGGPVFTFPFTATVSPDGRRIQLNYEAIAFDGSRNRWEKYLVRR